MFKKDKKTATDNQVHNDLQEKVKAAKKEAEAQEQTQNDNQIDALKKDLDDMTELAKRTMADMQNMKRRMEEERTAVFQIATADFISKILPVIDNLQRAAQNMPEEASDWYKGVQMSLNQMNQILTDSGLEKIETVGAQFDPNLHEALMQGPGKNNVITEELESGYKLGDRVIRHAKVKVGNGEKE